MKQHSFGNPPRNRKIAKFYYMLPFCIFDACFEEFFATDFFVKIKKNYVHTLQLFGSLFFMLTTERFFVLEIESESGTFDTVTMLQ